MIKKVYLDSSVIGGVFDEEFSEGSRQLFEEFNKGLYIPVISEIVYNELQYAPKKVKENFDKFSDIVEYLDLNEEAIELSKIYLTEGKFSDRLKNDTLHIAIESINKIDILVSWNFKDIVNLNRIQIYNAVNLKNGYSQIEIRNPREILHD
jgi:predicted nucleic acid-binding protein